MATKPNYKQLKKQREQAQKKKNAEKRDHKEPGASQKQPSG